MALTAGSRARGRLVLVGVGSEALLSIPGDLGDFVSAERDPTGGRLGFDVSSLSTLSDRRAACHSAHGLYGV